MAVGASSASSASSDRGWGGRKRGLYRSRRIFIPIVFAQTAERDPYFRRGLGMFRFFRVVRWSVDTIFGAGLKDIGGRIVVVRVSPDLTNIFVVVDDALFVYVLRLFFYNVVVGVFFFRSSLGTILFNDARVSIWCVRPIFRGV